MTSVGSGSLMIVLLLFLYPMLGANQLVGTDLTQAVPLTLAAALGALAFGHVEFGVTVSLIIGSVPAVFVGSLLSSSAPDRYIRPAITFVILASGLKYVGLGTDDARLAAVRDAARGRDHRGYAFGRKGAIYTASSPRRRQRTPQTACPPRRSTPKRETPSPGVGSQRMFARMGIRFGTSLAGIAVGLLLATAALSKFSLDATALVEATLIFWLVHLAGLGVRVESARPRAFDRARRPARDRLDDRLVVHRQPDRQRAAHQRRRRVRVRDADHLGRDRRSATWSAGGCSQARRAERRAS